MALISPDEFKKSKGKESTVKKKSGLISPSEFKEISKPQPKKEVIETKQPHPANVLRASTIMDPISTDLNKVAARLPKEDPFVTNFKESAERITNDPKPKNNLLLDIANKAITQGRQNMESLTEGRETVLGSPLAPRDALKIPNKDSSLTERAKFIGTILPRLVTDPVGEIGAQVYMPGAGVSKVASAYDDVGNLITRLAPKLTNSRVGRVAEELIKDVAVSAPIEFGYAAKNAKDNKELLKQTAIGTGIGAGLGGIMSGAIEGVQALRRPATLPKIEEALKQSVNSESNAIVEMPKNVSLEPVKADTVNQGWFERLFGEQGVGITAGRRSGEGMIDTHIVKDSKERASLIQKSGEIASTVEQELIDKFSPFRQIDKDTYNAAMDSTRANNLANVTIKDKFVDLEGNVIGKSLKDVYKNVPRGQKYLADRYTIMRDAVSRMERGIKVYGDEAWFPKSADEATSMLANLEERNPWLVNFGKDWNEFNANRQNLWVESGIASKELIDTLRHTNPNYAPMQRQQTRGSLRSRLNSSKSGFSGQKAPIKRALGSSKKIIDPAQSMIESTGTSYHAMLRNRAMTKMYDAVLKDPEKYSGVLDIVDESAEMKKLSLDEINDILREEGPEGVIGKLNGELDNIFKKSKQSTGKDDAIVTVMVDGSPVKMRVGEPSLLKAVEGIAPEQLGVALNIANFISKAIKQSATGMLAPVQGAKLALRDLPIALAQSKDKKRFVLDISHALVSQIADWLPGFVPGAEKMGNLARQYYRAGGGYEAYLKGDSTIRAVSSDITKDPILSGRNLWKTAKKVNPLRPLKSFGDGLENIPRISAFAAEMRKNGWKRDPESVRAAVDAGREATVNWSRRGTKGTGIEAVLPYSNAAVQGTYRLVKRFKEQPISATLLIMGIAGAKIASYEKFKDDPDYKQRSKWEKGIPISKDKNGKFITQPVEPTEAFIADQLLHFYKWSKDGEKAPGVKDLVREGADALLPKYAAGPLSAFTTDGVPFDPKEGLNATMSGSVIEPINAAVSGKNFFGGDIVPREYQDLPTDLQYDSTTSAAGKWAAENLNIDAFTFDYLGEKFGGDIAKIGLPMTSDVGKADPAGNLWDETLTRLKLLEDPVMKNRISDDFYTRAETVTQAKAANLRKDIPLPAWYQEAYDHVTSTKKGSIASQVQSLNSSKKEVERNVQLTAKERADQLRDIQREINLLRIEGIKIMEGLGVPKK